MKWLKLFKIKIKTNKCGCSDAQRLFKSFQILEWSRTHFTNPVADFYDIKVCFWSEVRFLWLQNPSERAPLWWTRLQRSQWSGSALKQEKYNQPWPTPAFGEHLGTCQGKAKMESTWLVFFSTPCDEDVGEQTFFTDLMSTCCLLHTHMHASPMKWWHE